MKTVFLIGFMGSGKTTFGKKLAAKLHFKFIDLDSELCLRNGVESVKFFIEHYGIDAFRKTENETLKSLELNNAVISTGGGTPCYFDALEWMKLSGTVVFLSVEEGVILSRLKTTDLLERPLLIGLDDEGLKTFIHEKLQERLPFYQQAHITFDPVRHKIEELLDILNNTR